MNLTMQQLEAGVDHIRQSPRDHGRVEMMVRRPAVDERVVLEQGELNLQEGLSGDTWQVRPSRHTPDGSPLLDAQITVMNARAIALIAGEQARWPLAGDQLFIDLDLSDENLPAGSKLQIGTAVIEVTPQPHNGCAKFAARFGNDAVKFVNSPVGKQLHLRGINAKVVRGGTIRVGDLARKL
jgi:hypothetical protein